MDNLKKLENLFTEIVNNHQTFNGFWQNIPLGKQAFALMRDSLPLRVKGELTPYTRIVLLGKMMECMPEKDCARFFYEVKTYQQSLFQLISDDDLAEDMDIDEYEGSPEQYERQYTIEDHAESLQRTKDYINLDIPMEEWCKKYDVMLKFDPVERTSEWEACIYEVEKECYNELLDERKGMGFCFSYWSTKRAVLARHGIEWCSPAAMNPGVMFD